MPLSTWTVQKHCPLNQATFLCLAKACNKQTGCMQAAFEQRLWILVWVIKTGFIQNFRDKIQTFPNKIFFFILYKKLNLYSSQITFANLKTLFMLTYTWRSMTLWSVSDINVGPFFQKNIIKSLVSFASLLEFLEKFPDFDKVYIVSKPIQAFLFFPYFFKTQKRSFKIPKHFQPFEILYIPCEKEETGVGFPDTLCSFFHTFSRPFKVPKHFQPFKTLYNPCKKEETEWTATELQHLLTCCSTV